jgi:hypothetical protein
VNCTFIVGPRLVNMCTCILIGQGQNHHFPFERVVTHLPMNGMNPTDELSGNERLVTERRMKPTRSKDLRLWCVFIAFTLTH